MGGLNAAAGLMPDARSTAGAGSLAEKLERERVDNPILHLGI